MMREINIVMWGLATGISVGSFLWPSAFEFMRPTSRARVEASASNQPVAATVSASVEQPKIEDEKKKPQSFFDSKDPLELVDGKDTIVSWQPIEEAARYRLIVRDRDGRRVRTRVTEQTEIAIPAPKAPYAKSYWLSLAALDKKGNEVSESDRRKVVIKE